MATPNPIPLFTVPIPACDNHPGGSITITEPQPQVYLLTIHSPPDNRLTTACCQSLLRALDLVEFSGPLLAPGCVVTTSSLPKFYSNGLDLTHAAARGDTFWTDSLWALYRRLLTYPMPTVAWMNGHAFAGGLMLAMHHDYRVMNPARGFCCLNELDFGAPLKPAMSAVFRVKVPDPRVYREMVLEAKRECLDLLDSHGREEEKDRGWVRGEEERKARGKREVEEWVKKDGKAKL
ncbi:hypothetical protein VMCG_05437 [Cytospora schulzeri]|uniref:Enoyl-CoA hydratase n=1 Tax=Cytospora schulzeri TaxID=448051 RepID=A0A423WK12_9PEZI|nr:hypothetical protein VMCG_05437 [Valsa malicola]